ATYQTFRNRYVPFLRLRGSVLCFGSVKRNGRLIETYFDTTAHVDQEGRFGNFDDTSVDTRRCYDAIIFFQLFDILFVVFGLFHLRPNHEEVKNHDNKDHGKESHDPTGSAGTSGLQ